MKSKVWKQFEWGPQGTHPRLLKLETFFRMAEMGGDEVFPPMGGEEPPARHDGDAISKGIIKKILKDVHDTAAIVDRLQEFHRDVMDDDLTEWEKYLGHALECIFKGPLSCCILYTHWFEIENYKHVAAEMAQRFSPKRVESLTKKAREKIEVLLNHQDLYLNDVVEIYERAQRHIQAISHILGNKPYFLGERPYSVDATAFGYLANIIWGTVDSPLRDAVMATHNLRDYCIRMKKQFFDIPTRLAQHEKEHQCNNSVEMFKSNKTP